MTTRELLYVIDRVRLEKQTKPVSIDSETMTVTIHPDGAVAFEFKSVTAEELAKFFHATYERLAPQFGYETREASGTIWESVPENNRRLMIATATEVLIWLRCKREEIENDGTTMGELRPEATR